MEEIRKEHITLMDALLASKYGGIATLEFINDVENYWRDLKNKLPNDSEYFEKCMLIDKVFDAYVEGKRF